MLKKFRLVITICTVLMTYTVAFAQGHKAFAEDMKTSNSDYVHSSLDEYTLEGTLHFIGIPMSTITDVKPSFWFFDVSTQTVYEDAVTTYDSTSGEYQISNLPPREMRIFFLFHVNSILILCLYYNIYSKTST